MTDPEGRKPEWTNISRLSDAAVAKITCGAPSLAEYKPEPAIHDLLRLDTAREVRILDFGAGLLRHTIALAEASPRWTVVSYEQQPMIDRGKRIYAEKLAVVGDRISFVNTCAQWANHKFDTVFASLVFQHMLEPHLRMALRCIYDCSPRLAVAGRRTLDDGKRSVWAIVQDYFNLVEITAHDESAGERALNLNEGDPHDHTTAIFVKRG